jgi:hypothetical protein
MDGADRPRRDETAKFCGHRGGAFSSKTRNDRARNLAEADPNLNRTKGQP